MSLAWLDVVPELRFAYDLARQAGDLLLARPDTLHTATKTSHTDLVTQMDQDSEAFLVAALRDRYPQDGIVGEEGADRVGGSGRQWVLDPLDGTVNYFYDLPAWAVSIALVDDTSRAGLVGVVHAPGLGLTLAAARGHGARRVTPQDTQAVQVSACASLDLALVGTGFGYDAARRRAQARVLTDVLPAVRDIRRMGSCAVDLCCVAMGALDAYFERGVHEWDFAAGGLIVSESGGVVTGLRGQPPGSSMVVATSPLLHGPLTAILEHVEADSDFWNSD